MPLRPALGVRGTVAGRRLGALGGAIMVRVCVGGCAQGPGVDIRHIGSQGGTAPDTADSHPVAHAPGADCGLLGGGGMQ